LRTGIDWCSAHESVCERATLTGTTVLTPATCSQADASRGAIVTARPSRASCGRDIAVARHRLRARHCRGATLARARHCCGRGHGGRPSVR
jgi:hypothetical protein